MLVTYIAGLKTDIRLFEDKGGDGSDTVYTTKKKFLLTCTAAAGIAPLAMEQAPGTYEEIQARIEICDQNGVDIQPQSLRMASQVASEEELEATVKKHIAEPKPDMFGRWWTIAAPYWLDTVPMNNGEVHEIWQHTEPKSGICQYVAGEDVMAICKTFSCTVFNDAAFRLLKMIGRAEGKQIAKYFFRTILKGWKESSHTRSNWKQHTPVELQELLNATINSCKGFLRMLSHIPGDGDSTASHLQDVWPSKLVTETKRVRGTAAEKCTLQLLNISAAAIHEYITGRKEWIELRLQAEKTKVTDQNHVEDYETAAVLLLEIQTTDGPSSEPKRKAMLRRVFGLLKLLHEGGLREDACELLDTGLLAALKVDLEDCKAMDPGQESVALLQEITDQAMLLKHSTDMVAECTALKSQWQTQCASTALVAALQRTKNCTAIEDTRDLHQALAAAQGQQIPKEVASLLMDARAKVVSKIGANILASGNNITDQVTRDELAVLKFMQNCPEFIAIVGGRARDVPTQRQLENMAKILFNLRSSSDYVKAHDKGSELEFNVGKLAEAIENWRDFVADFQNPDGHLFVVLF